MQIIRYGYSGDIDIKFLDEHGAILKNRTYTNFARGTVKNPYDKTVSGVGFVGVGEYKTNDENNSSIHCECYIHWANMLNRCYSDKWSEMYPAYSSIVSLCDEWHNYQNFAEWYEHNKYPVNERLHVDKDILIKGNKLYSPETCLLVPQRINMLFMDLSNRRMNDKDLPQGITRGYLSDGTFRYRVMYGGKSVGTFDTFEDAIDKYNKAKKKHIIDVANEYREIISQKAYDALINYEP
jgi:hypothetical protein